MNRLKTVLKDRSGQGTPMILAVVVCCLILACVVFEYMRLMIVAQGVRDSVQSAIVAVATENWDAPIIVTILPNDPPISGELSDIPVIDENISDDPALEEGGVGDKTVIGGGFVTDASGMICGISDLSVISEDGYLILPSEGCRGIAAGAFASCKDIISEIYIPANISEIEERAFTDLTSLGWIEMETSAGYYTEDGVLFSKDGTCLLAFPPARTGNYKVPSHVTEIADGAFDRAGISVLDASDCSVLEIRSLPSYIELRR